MAPRSVLSAGLAALITALLAVPAAAQIRATAVVEAAPDATAVTSPPPALVRVGDGFLAAWGHDYEQGVRALDANGAPAGPIRKVPKSEGLWHPAIQRLLTGPGGVTLVTEEVEDGSGYRRLALRRLAADGAPAPGEPLVVIGRADLAGSSALALADGSVLISAVVRFSSGSQVVTRLVRPDGTLGELRSVAAGACCSGVYSTRTSLAPAPGGALLAYNGPAPSGFTEIFVQRLDAAGAASGTAVQVTTSSDDDLTPSGGARFPALAYEPSRSEYLLVYDDRQDAVLEPWTVRAQRLDAAGVPAGAPVAVSASPTLLDGDLGPTGPVVISDPAAGGWITARREQGDEGTPRALARVLARWLPYADLTAGGPEVAVDDPAYVPGVPTLALGPAGARLAWRPQAAGATPVTRRLGSGPDPGVAVLDAAPSGQIATRDPELRWHSTRAAATLQCRLNAEAWKPCAVGGLGDGVHRLAVRSVGPEGWVELGRGAEATWRVEAAPPRTTLTGVPSPRLSQPTFTWATDEPATVECRWDGAATWQSCGVRGRTGTINFRTFADGPHSLELRATDDAGRREAVPFRWTWTVDTRPPDTQVLSGPEPDAQDDPARFVFGSDEAGVTYECAGPQPQNWSACRSGRAIEGLQGQLYVRAKDAAGNVDPTPASHRWRDATPPLSATADAFSPRQGIHDAFRYRIDSAPGQIVECQTAAGPGWERCGGESWGWTDLMGGASSVRVRLRGVNGPSGEISTGVSLPGREPLLAITERPPARTRATTARIVWRFTQASSFSWCSLDGRDEFQCSSPLVLEGLAPGTHELAVGPYYGSPEKERVRWEVLGAAAAKTRAATAAADEPDTTILGAPTGRIRTNTATVQVRSSIPGSRFSCSITGDDADCRNPDAVVLKNLRDGEHGFRATAIAPDGTRDSTPALALFEVNAEPPDASFEEEDVPDPRSTTAELIWGTGEGDYVVSTQCKLDGAVVPACESPMIFTGLAEGPHRFEVLVTDIDGVADPTPLVVEWTTESLTPLVTLRGPSDYFGPDSEHTFTADRAGATFECRFDRAGWAPCTSPVRHTGLADGPHRFQVRATNAGHTSPVVTSTWDVDTTPPDTRLVPDDRLVEGMRTALTSATFTIEARDVGEPGEHGWARHGFSADCRLDGKRLDCDEEIKLTGLADGPHVLEAWVYDGPGNVDPTPARFEWVVGADAPETEIASGPPAQSGSRRAAFALRAVGAADGFECRVDSGAWAPCPADQVASGLADGDHRLEARALSAGRADASPAVWTWRVDSGPTAAVVSGPAAVGDAREVTLTVAVDDAAATLQCRLDGGAWAACARTSSYVVGAGAHRFEARATDAGGQVGDSAAWEWTTDLTPPDTTLSGVSLRALSRFRSELLVIGGGETADRFECRLDAGEWSPCRAHWRLGNLPDGAHVAQARAVTADGRVDGTPAELRWTTDATAPTLSVERVTGAETKRTSATVRVTTDGSAECRVDQGAFVPCSGAHTVTGLAPGRHLLAVRATDAAGNTAAPVWTEWTQLEPVDATTEILSGPTPSFTFSGTGTSFRCRTDNGPWTACTSPHAPPTTPGAHVFEVAALDADGTPDPTPARHDWTVGGATRRPRPRSRRRRRRRRLRQLRRRPRRP